MSFYRSKPDDAPMYVQYLGHGHHFKDKRPNVPKEPGALWAIEGAHPGMEYFEAEAAAHARRPGRRGARPRLLRAGQHQRVSRTC